jgi:4-diphosphocytidyl-2-C-methyl-D-erythritol kinase
VSFEIFSPAKLNLFLAITGRRADGFHDLVSVAAPLDFGDTLRFELRPAGRFELTCTDSDLACDETNLILRAARAFCAATGWSEGAAIHLTKRTPMGAGLGGGSSNATATLRALNELTGHLLGPAALTEVAASLGSDCALFLHDSPVVMRGRGERIAALAGGGARLSGRQVLVFKPSFGIATAWAYRQMVAGAPDSYLPAAEAENRLARWLESPEAPAEQLLFNNMERPAFEKFIALPVLLGQLRREFGVAAGMSGSGSACYVLLPEKADRARAIAARIQDAWGPAAVVAQTRIR